MRILPNIKALIRRETKNFTKFTSYVPGLESGYKGIAVSIFLYNIYFITLSNKLHVKWTKINSNSWEIELFDEFYENEPIMTYNENIT